MSAGVAKWQVRNTHTHIGLTLRSNLRSSTSLAGCNNSSLTLMRVSPVNWLTIVYPCNRARVVSSGFSLLSTFYDSFCDYKGWKAFRFCVSFLHPVLPLTNMLSLLRKLFGTDLFHKTRQAHHQYMCVGLHILQIKFF